MSGSISTPIVYSLEVFPPRDIRKMARFWQAIDSFHTLRPIFISVTCGSFGNASTATKEIAARIRAGGSDPAIHITCLGKTKETMRLEIDRCKELGFNRIVALRGDRPSGARPAKPGEMQYALELVNLLKEKGEFDISVAAYPEGHPESPSLDLDITYLKEKLDAGATRAITQFFLDPETFLRFRDKAASLGITKPIVPGILPILNIDKIVSFCQKCQVDIPPFLLRMYDKIPNKDSLDSRLLAMNILSHQVTRLIQEGESHFHFYTLNETLLSRHICNWLQEAF